MMNDDDLEGQYQLFALINLFRRSQVSRPVYLEGAAVNQPLGKLQVPITAGPYTNMSIDDPHMQDYLATHPDHYKQLVVAARGAGASNIDFYCLSTYQHFRGIHQPSVKKMVEEIMPCLESLVTFPQKYSTRNLGPPQIVVTEGRPKVWVNGQVFEPSDVLNDCEEFLREEDNLRKLDDLREDELTQRFCEECDDEPVGWVGISHEQALSARCSTRGLRMVSIMPSAMRNNRQNMATHKMRQQDVRLVREFRDWVRNNCEK